VKNVLDLHLIDCEIEIWGFDLYTDQVSHLEVIHAHYSSVVIL